VRSVGCLSPLEVAPGSARAAAAERPTTAGPGGSVVALLLAVLAVVAAVGSIVTVYRVGDSGARAVWTGHFSAQAQPSPLRRPQGG